MIINPYRYAGPSDLDQYGAPVAWYRSGEGVTVDGTSGYVTEWQDQSGNGYHLSSGNSSNGHTFNSAAQNGLDTYGPPNSTATTSNLGNRATAIPAADLANGGSPISFVWVGKRGGGFHYAMSVTSGTTANSVADVIWLNATTLRYRARNSAGIFANAPDYAFGTGTTYHTFGLVVQSNAIRGYVDGVEVTSLTSGFTFLPSTNDRFVGLQCASYAISSSTVTGPQGEAVVWDADQATNMAGIHSILAARWGL